MWPRKRISSGASIDYTSMEVAVSGRLRKSPLRRWRCSRPGTAGDRRVAALGWDSRKRDRQEQSAGYPRGQRLRRLCHQVLFSAASRKPFHQMGRQGREVVRPKQAAPARWDYLRQLERSDEGRGLMGIRGRAWNEILSFPSRSKN